MITVNLIISLGTSIFVALMVFLYFRNRIKSLEFKLNTMFQLIQDHVAKQKVEEKELIQVSDNEEWREGAGHDLRSARGGLLHVSQAVLVAA